MSDDTPWKEDDCARSHFLLYLVFYGCLLMQAAQEEPWAILLGIPLVLLGIGSIYTLYTRIREIRSGEEDDLDNY